MELPATKLREKARIFAVNINSEKFAKHLDEEDPLANFREKFCIPKMKDLPCVDQELVDPEHDCIYFCGNSLGPKPKSADYHMQKCLDDWTKWGVLSHFQGDLPAASCDLFGIPATARLIGAKPNEVALMNGLTVNLHLLLVSFYKPNDKRYKILIESRAFPSDRYAIQSQIRYHGHDPDDALIQLEPRNGEYCLRTDDILKTIEEEGENIAVVVFSGVQYSTGQKFEIKRITEAGHVKGCIVGFDLAHAIGNVKLNIHEWNVDFACWCSYKYMNSGAGGMAGAFIHEKNYPLMAALRGWWGNIEETRFEMKEKPDLDLGVAGLRLSNPAPWLACLNIASLEIFEETSVDELVKKQFFLTGYLEYLLDTEFKTDDSIVIIITPRDPEQRGCQLSVKFRKDVKKIHTGLEKRGVLCDLRNPDILRLAPAPLYNSFSDVYYFVQLLKQVINEM